MVNLLVETPHHARHLIVDEWRPRVVGRRLDLRSS
jgi:hypothetical protein